MVGIDPGKGSVLWTQKIGEPVRSSPTAGGKVYFVSTDSVLHLDGNDGQELWIAKGVPEPAILLQCQPCGGTASWSRLFRQATSPRHQVGSGQPAWRDTLSRTSETSAAGILADPARPVIDRGVVFVVGHGGRMIAVFESSGERLDQERDQHADAVVGRRRRLRRRWNGKLGAGAGDKVRWITQLPGTARWNGRFRRWQAARWYRPRARSSPSMQEAARSQAPPRSARRCSSLHGWRPHAYLRTTPC